MKPFVRFRMLGSAWWNSPYHIVPRDLLSSGVVASRNWSVATGMRDWPVCGRRVSQ